jgi:hypothetical protein
MTDEGDADLLMAMAEERLAEATRLAGQPRGADLAEALAGYDQAISRLLSLSHGASTDQGVAALEKVQARLAKHTQLLAGLRERAPAAGKDGLERALERSNERRNEVDDLLRQRGNRPETPPGRDPGTTPAPLVPTAETGRGKGPKEDRGPSTKIPPGQATPSP